MYGFECEVITNDVCEIASRVKEVDANYIIVKNRKNGHFEIYDGTLIGNGFVCGLPYDTLDERTVAFIRQTRTERLDALLAELDEENERREK